MCSCCYGNSGNKQRPRGAPPDLDGDGAPPLEDEVASLEVLVGGAAELDVHLLRRTNTQSEGDQVTGDQVTGDR